MKSDRELMQMALLALDLWKDALTDPCADYAMRYRSFGEDATKALRERLAQPECEFECPRYEHCCQQREWVWLTDEEIYDYADKFLYQHGSNYGIKSFGKAIEAKLKEKNSG